MFDPRGPTLFELARQALSSTERGYDLLATRFDYTPFRTPDAVLSAVAEAIGPPGSIGSALDVCCGTGAAMRALRPLCRDRVVGVDVSRGMLVEARRRLADAPGDAPIDILRADARELPFECAFDVVTCFGAFGHILAEDEPRFVRSVARTLKPGGRFVFVTMREPGRLSASYVLSKSFNAAMHVRNALLSPPFVMYYLTFLLPRAAALLAELGFHIEVHDDVLPAPWSRGVLVIATRC